MSNRAFREVSVSFRRSMSLVASSVALLVGAASTAHAQWTVVNLHPVGATQSSASAASGGQQAGYVYVGNSSYTHASLWSGSAASWVDLNPAGSPTSWARAASGGLQAGFATVGGAAHAGLWSGTAASWVDLNPAGAVNSQAYAADTRQ